jgi:hypothetical protein
MVFCSIDTGEGVLQKSYTFLIEKEKREQNRFKKIKNMICIWKGVNFARG